MITMQEWKVMSHKEQTLWLEDNCHASKSSLSRRGTLHGVGVNDTSYCATPIVGGKQVMCPAYKAWQNMLNRAYSDKIHARYPTYIGVTVCKEWHSFMAFRKWWMEHQVGGYHLDKDILGDSLEYSPNTCLFVPQWLNKFTNDHGAARGEWPIGVHFNKSAGRFHAQCSNPLTGKREHLGLFDTPDGAYLAWRARKLELALELKPLMDAIDLRIYTRMIELSRNAK